MIHQDGDVHQLEAYREYLGVIAQLQLRLNPLMRGKVDASDIVQETFLKAHKNWDQFHGRTDVELAHWLRQILVNQLTDLLRRFGSAGRELFREKSLEEALQESSVRFQTLLTGHSPSPGDKAVHQETLLRLSRALVALPDDQRTALELKYLAGEPLDEVGRQLGRSKAAVAGLLHRGVVKLRQLLQDSL
jgi:RNA polymerase sigma-70 factor (ECF subfamily)